MSVYSVPGGHRATNFTDFILLALLDNLITCHPSILQVETEAMELSNWVKVILFVNGKNRDANPSVLCLPKCDPCIASKAVHCLS